MDVAALVIAVVALLVSGGSVYFTRMQGVAARTSASIDKGDTTTWRIALGHGHPATITLRIRARAGDELPWNVVQTVDLPYDVTDSIY